MKSCHVCGEPYEVDSNGIANHLTDDGNIDHDVDGDHVPYSLDETPTPEKVNDVRLNARELATVLAALRYYQGFLVHREEYEAKNPVIDIATDCEQFEAMDAKEVGDLCERINC
jgi:hypothetical protein